jgi:hypothetical protein
MQLLGDRDERLQPPDLHGDTLPRKGLGRYEQRDRTVDRRVVGLLPQT